MTGFRVTYATLTADDDELHAAYDAALEDVGRVRAAPPTAHRSEARDGAAGFETVSPVDRTVVIGEFAAATATDVADAVAAARRGPAGVGGDAWRERVADPRSGRRR